jgi:hypothetical protein
LFSCKNPQDNLLVGLHDDADLKAQFAKGFPIFSDIKTENDIIFWQKRENRRFGLERHQKRYHKVKFKKTTLMQRSGRKRLYDHNIFLRALYAGKIPHKEFGDLGPKFQGALFVDIGSAILMGDGAPTVRDIYEDNQLRPHLSQVLATDINDKSNPSSMYVDIYLKEKNNLPFPVREVPMALNSDQSVNELLKSFLKEKTPVILRSANSGPDLFYSEEDLAKHFRAIIRSFYKKEVLYFFNKFVLYKNAQAYSFQNLGLVDPSIGTSHRALSWEDINWKKRSLKNAFHYNPDHLAKPEVK